MTGQEISTPNSHVIQGSRVLPFPPPNYCVITARHFTYTCYKTFTILFFKKNCQLYLKKIKSLEKYPPYLPMQLPFWVFFVSLCRSVFPYDTILFPTEGILFNVSYSIGLCVMNSFIICIANSFYLTFILDLFPRYRIISALFVFFHGYKNVAPLSSSLHYFG